MRPHRLSAALRVGAALLVVMSAGACKPEQGGSGATSASPPSASAAASAPAPPSPYADGDLKVAEDFAAQADKDITADNYKDKLAELAQELDPQPADAGAADAGGPALRNP